MKKYINNSKLLLATAALSALVISCSQDAMDDVNKDINHTQDAPAKFIIADVITSTAFSNSGGDINTYASTYVEHEVGTDNQLYRAEHRQSEPSAASTFNNVWGNLYSTLKNARLVIEKCSEGGSQEGNNITKGVAEVLAAYNSALIADMFGDAPWSQAALPSKTGTPVYMNPKIDTQEEIYAGIMKYLDDAIVDLSGTDAHPTGPLGVYDFLYGGSKSKWLKFAYGLKARYTMRLLKRSANQEANLLSVIDFADKSFKSASEQAAFAIYDESNLNPTFDYQWSRDGLAASESMSNKLIERNDPRLRRVFVDANWIQVPDQFDPIFYMAPNGENDQVRYTYNTSIFVFSQTAPTLLLSYHEILFLKAEALIRLDRTSEAQAILKKAVVAAIANTETSVAAAFNSPIVNYYGGLAETTDAIYQSEAGTYFDDEILPLFTANPMKEAMNQKYIAFFGASGESTECYNDIRRLKGLGENLITLQNPNEFPLRCPYGNDDTTTNPEVQAAYGTGQYVYVEPVWWAGGTR
jgi:hypothetical protein